MKKFLRCVCEYHQNVSLGAFFIPQANNLLRVHEKKLQLLQRKRRLLFPGDALPDPPPQDDYVPDSNVPLIKHVEVSDLPADRVTQIKLLSSPLVMPTKSKPNNAVAMSGAVLMVATQGGTLLMYDSFGALVTTIDTGFGQVDITAIAVVTAGHKAIIALGAANGTIGLYNVLLRTIDLTNFTVTPVDLNETKIANAESEIEDLSKAPITALHIFATGRGTIIYAGDSEGWLKAYSREGIILKQIKVAVDPSHMEDNRDAISGIACCAGNNLLVSTGRSVSVITTTDLIAYHCHREDSGVSSMAIETRAHHAAYVASASGDLKYLRVSRALSRTSNPAKNGTYCQVATSRQMKTTASPFLENLKGYLLVRHAHRVSIYNATRAAHFAPWHVFDVPSNSSEGAKVLLSSDKKASFVMAQEDGAQLTMYHTGLPELSAETGMEMPGRPYIIGAAVLFVFAYQWYNRKESGSGSGGRRYDDEEDYAAPRKKQGYGKYGPPAGSRTDGYSGSKFGAPSGKRALGDNTADIASRAKSMEDQLSNLNKMTQDLSSSMSRP